MASHGQSSCYKINTFFWKIFGIWQGRGPSKYYKYYSFVYISITLAAYIILLTLNFFYAPRKIEILIREGIFYFTVLAVAFKVMMVLRMRAKILEVFDILDCEQFQGKDHIGKYIIEKNKYRYKIFWRIIASMSNFAYVLQCVVPASLYFIWNKKVDLPICQYYFLSDELRENYFMLWFFYQSLGIYGHMTYNINIDTFIAGLILMMIVQLKILKHNFSEMKLKKTTAIAADNASNENICKLNEMLQHYELILKYSSLVENIVSLTMFVQFNMAACIICVVALLMVSSSESAIYLLTYLVIMVMQIFLPAYLGTQLTYESQELQFAAYNSDWMPQSESYKRSFRLFVERANRPIVITGLKMFPLALSTFISIIKMAYSCFALVRKVQDRQS